MIEAGYPANSSLAFLLANDAGAVAGVLISAKLADRFGPRPLTLVAFLEAAAALLAMAMNLFPLVAMYFFVAGLGFGPDGIQILINGYVATFFDDRLRATALGVTLGIGRIGAIIADYCGGILVFAQLGTFTDFGDVGDRRGRRTRLHRARPQAQHRGTHGDAILAGPLVPPPTSWRSIGGIRPGDMLSRS